MGLHACVLYLPAKDEIGLHGHDKRKTFIWFFQYTNYMQAKQLCTNHPLSLRGVCIC